MGRKKGGIGAEYAIKNVEGREPMERRPDGGE
jgi:hypothetical protein